MPHVEKTVVPHEKGSAKVTWTFKNASGGADVPAWVKWTLVDSNGMVINNRRKVVATPGASVEIYLYGNDLKVLSAEEGRDTVKRFMILQAEGSDGYPINDSLEFDVHNLKYVVVTTTTTTTTTTT